MRNGNVTTDGETISGHVSNDYKRTSSPNTKSDLKPNNCNLSVGNYFIQFVQIKSSIAHFCKLCHLQSDQYNVLQQPASRLRSILSHSVCPSSVSVRRPV